MDKTQYYEIDLLQLLGALWHRMWAIILAAIIAGGIAFSYTTFAITPLYEAQTLLYVNNSSLSLGSTSFSISSSELSAAQSLVDTYIVILKSRTSLNEVIEKAGLNYTYNQLYSMITSASVNNTEVFSVKITSADPQEAELIANTIAEVLPEKIADVVEGSSVRIVDYAVVPASKSSPSISRNTALGAIIGVVIACVIIVIIELTDTIIHDEDYLIQSYDLPVLAVIPNLYSSDSSRYYKSYAASGTVKKG